MITTHLVFDIATASEGSGERAEAARRLDECWSDGSLTLHLLCGLRHAGRVKNNQQQAQRTRVAKVVSAVIIPEEDLHEKGDSLARRLEMADTHHR